MNRLLAGVFVPAGFVVFLTGTTAYALSPIAAVSPEPHAMLALGTGLIAAAAYARRRMQR